jgi:hypothetical protein
MKQKCPKTTNQLVNLDGHARFQGVTRLTGLVKTRWMHLFSPFAGFRGAVRARLWLALWCAAGSCLQFADAQTLQYQVSLDYFFPSDMTKAQTSFTSRIMVDAKNGSPWSIKHSAATANTGIKFAGTYGDCLLWQVYNEDSTNRWSWVSYDKEGYPIELPGELRLLWFVYCANTYIHKNNGKPVIIPYSEGRLYAYLHSCRMETSWRSDKDLCPQEAKWVYDHATFTNAINELSYDPPGDFLEARDKAYQDFVKYHTNGDVVVEFKVSSWQQVGEVGVPATWEMDFNLWHRPIDICVGKTLAVTNIAADVELPRFNPVELVTDSRVRLAKPGLNYTTYKVTNGILPSVASLVADHAIGTRSQGAVLTGNSLTKPLQGVKPRP